MDTSMAEIRLERDGRGCFAPGQSGNPAGRKPGSRNLATKLREVLAEPDVERAIEILREQLRDGRGVAARFVLERLFPKPRDRDIDLGLPPPEEGTTLADMFDRILWLMASGEITVDEASRMAKLIEQRRGQGGMRAAVAARADAAPSPASGLQTAGAAGDVVRPLNRHERRRAAALGLVDGGVSGSSRRPAGSPAGTRREGRA